MKPSANSSLLCPSDLSVELAAEVLAADEARELGEFRNKCREYLREIDEAIRILVEIGECSTFYFFKDKYVSTIADALRIQGYSVRSGAPNKCGINVIRISW